MGKVNNLPNELLRYFFLLLSPEDRKTVVLVSRRWRRVGEDPILWKRSFITIHNGDDINKLSPQRFSFIQEFDVNRFQKIDVDLFKWTSEQLEQLFRATLELSKLKRIGGLQWLDLRCVNSELLLKDLMLIGNRTTNDQRLVIFSKMLQNGCGIKTLNLVRMNLGGLKLEAQLLATVMSRLEQLNLSCVKLTKHQVRELFKSICEKNQLYSVGFHFLNVSSVEPEMFGKAMTKIACARLDNIVIWPQQIRAFFTEMGRSNRINSFFSIDSNLSAANPKLFAKGLSKLEEVELVTNNLGNEQVRSLFKELNHNWKLTSLDLIDNDLSSVDPVDLAKVVNNIEMVDVSDTKLSTEQITGILTLAQQNTKLIRLNISGNDISQVDPVLLTTGRAIIDELEIDSESEDNESDEDDSPADYSLDTND